MTIYEGCVSSISHTQFKNCRVKETVFVKGRKENLICLTEDLNKLGHIDTVGALFILCPYFNILLSKWMATRC